MSTREERMRIPLAIDVITATAEQHGVCVRPFMMEVGDLDTGELRHVGVPCGSTVESVCGPCARKARALRIVQCREGWHLDDEPDFTPESPSEDHKALLTLRADLVAAYRDSDGADLDDLRDEILSVDEELRALGMRGRLPALDVPVKVTPKRSTKRRQDAPDLPRRRVEKRTLGREFAGRFRPSMFVTLTCDSPICMPQSAVRSRKRCCGLSLLLPTSKCGGRSMTRRFTAVAGYQPGMAISSWTRTPGHR